MVISTLNAWEYQGNNPVAGCGSGRKIHTFVQAQRDKIICHFNLSYIKNTFSKVRFFFYMKVNKNKDQKNYQFLLFFTEESFLFINETIQIYYQSVWFQQDHAKAHYAY